MKICGTIILLLGTHLAAAHYVFGTISVNDGPASKPFQYTRKLSDGPGYDGVYYANYVPHYDVYSNDIRCGWGAYNHGSNVETLAVNAGDEIKFFSTRLRETTGEEEDIMIHHPGPGQAYLSRLEHGTLEEYKGDGDWFKISSLVAKDDKNWLLYNQHSMNFTIPRTTPPGKYLMRVEHIFPFSTTFNDTQFYISCTHVEIKGLGGGKPGPMVRFPGVYDHWDHAIWVPYHVGNSTPWNLTKYVAPGPRVWSG